MERGRGGLGREEGDRMGKQDRMGCCEVFVDEKIPAPGFVAYMGGQTRSGVVCRDVSRMCHEGTNDVERKWNLGHHGFIIL